MKSTYGYVFEMWWRDGGNNPMTALDNYRKDTDIISLIESDLGQGRRSGQWMQFHCPFGHDDKTPSLAAKNGDGKRGPFFKCFACGESGSAIDWLMKYRNMTMAQVLEHIQGNAVTFTPRPKYEQAPSNNIPPEEWEASAFEAMEKAEHNLWNSAAGERALKWLTGPERLLTEGSIRAWNLGFSEGLQVGGLRVAYGIVIPCYESGVISYLKIRRPVGKPKYIKVAGSQPGLFGADTMYHTTITFVTEGEFDAMMLFQCMCKEYINAGVITAGSATDSIDPNRWARHFLTCQRIVAIYDMDEAGRKGFERLAMLSGNVIRATFPEMNQPVKDVTDFVKAGGDLVGWLKYQMEVKV
jgi:DNA primase